MPEIELNQQTVVWQHEIKRNLRHSYISVRPEGVLLRSPPMPRAEAEALLRRKADWIVTRLARQPEAGPQLSSGRPCLLRGQEYRLRLHSDPQAALIRVWTEGPELVLQLPEACLPHENLRADALRQFLQREAVAFMQPRMAYWSAQMQLTPTRVLYKYHRRRWGSCTARNAINLNYRAIQLPEACIDSILVHELAHIRHKNHGPHFWALVLTHIPDYHALNATIKALAPRLL
jgi:predicted metal-dependent hydrolase